MQTWSHSYLQYSLPFSLCLLHLSPALHLITTHSKARAHAVYYPGVGGDGTVYDGEHCCLRNKSSNVPNLTGSPFSPIGPAGPTPPCRPGWPIAPAGPAGPLSPVAPWKKEEIEMWGEHMSHDSLFDLMCWSRSVITMETASCLMCPSILYNIEAWQRAGDGMERNLTKSDLQ